MKTFNKFFSDALLIAEDVSASALGAMSEEEFRQFLKGIQDSAKRSQYTRMRQAQVRNAQSPLRPTNPGVTNPGRSPQVPRPNNSTFNRTVKDALNRRVKDALDPSKAGARARRLAGGVGRFGLSIGADMAADQAINQIPDKRTRETVRGVKEIGVGAMTPVYTATQIAQPGEVTRSDVEIDNPFGQGGKLLKGRSRGQGRDNESYADWLKHHNNNDAPLPTWLGGRKGGPEYNDPRLAATYIPGSEITDKNPYGTKNSGVKVGAARLGGEIIPVEWGSVAGEKRVGTPQDVTAVKARQKAGQQGAYGSRQGVAVVGTSKNTTFNKKDNTITSGGRTAKLPSTKILSGGRVGDLAYKDGKPVYLARADIAQRGNQNLFARLSRATGIGGQREKDAAALKREREQALQNTLKYRKEIGAGGGSISAK